MLTVRDPHTWYPSVRMMGRLISGENLLEESADVPGSMRQVFASMRRLRPALDQIGRSYFGPDWHMGADLADEDLAVAAFNRHVARVKENVDAERLLVFDVREGWEPLCAFLGVEVPAGEPFPHLNDAQSCGRWSTG